VAKDCSSRFSALHVVQRRLIAGEILVNEFLKSRLVAVGSVPELGNLLQAALQPGTLGFPILFYEFGFELRDGRFQPRGSCRRFIRAPVALLL
jgi:hypothetical protein